MKMVCYQDYLAVIHGKSVDQKYKASFNNDITIIEKIKDDIQLSPF